MSRREEVKCDLCEKVQNANESGHWPVKMMLGQNYLVYKFDVCKDCMKDANGAFKNLWAKVFRTKGAVNA
jgi:hypothetical protein